ncbi:MAG: SlyX family protein [Rhodospirillales bacterium]|jgi:SlyX protein|nr:SlyX family protein [Rhodospirillales bacterium]
MTDSLEPRLSDLETRLAYVDRMVEDLSSVIATQDREIDRLTQQVRRMAERMGDIDAQLDRAAAPDDKPPPHY